MTEKLDTSRRAVRKFGILFCCLSAVISAFLLFKGRGGWPWFAGASLFFLGTGLVGYPVLKPVYQAWMKFAFLLGWLNTRLILGVFFYLILTPIGLVLRLTGRDLLDRKIDPAARTYWSKREVVPFDPERCERMY